jgi:group I intron endonuclease
MILYQATNQINGKSYIGITRTTLAKRVQSHGYAVKRGSQTAFHCAIRKYGIENFVFEEIASSVSWKSLQEAERQAIHQRKTLSPDGYNLSSGGDGFSGRHTQDTIEGMKSRTASRWANMSDEERKEIGRRISAAKKGKQQPWCVDLGKKQKGSKRSEEFKKKVSDGMKRYVMGLEHGEMARRARSRKPSSHESQ